MPKASFAILSTSRPSRCTCRRRPRRAGRGRRSRSPRSARARSSGPLPARAPRAAGWRPPAPERRAPAAGWRTAPGPCAAPAVPARAGRAGSVVSHFGPPTAPSSTASEARQRSSTSGSRGVPCSSIEAPPTGACSTSKPASKASIGPSTAASPAPMTSGPMPSPGSATMRTGPALGHGTSGSCSAPGLLDLVHAVGQIGHVLLQLRRPAACCFWSVEIEEPASGPDRAARELVDVTRA